jgi:hypothetical protein
LNLVYARGVERGVFWRVWRGVLFKFLLSLFVIGARGFRPVFTPLLTPEKSSSSLKSKSLLIENEETGLAVAFSTAGCS